jgi:phosphopantetheine--protein transferase-like protein
MLGRLDMNTHRVKEIVATFLKKEVDEIDDNTRIDNNAIRGSVLLHRMYSELKSNGFETQNYNEIHTFGDLVDNLSGIEDTVGIYDSHLVQLKAQVLEGGNKPNEENIGIDIESPNNLPNSSDYHQEQFYIDNFSVGEISYCSSKDDPKSCFAGRFAAKEAIIKADNQYKNIKFSEIEIKISESGRPTFPGLAISISHMNYENINFSAAIAKNIALNSSESELSKSNYELEALRNDNVQVRKDIHKNAIQNYVYLVALFIAIFLLWIDKI